MLVYVIRFTFRSLKSLHPKCHWVFWESATIENDRSHLARLLVKARVINLQDVPHFIVISEDEQYFAKTHCSTTRSASSKYGASIICILSI
jgi:hypothetical protein